ncbi:MAG: DNA-processing protein DprA [Rhodobacteraceae bacterium]|nr:DNA-processing protein DprA [Paracoccaceae bacterium]
MALPPISAKIPVAAIAKSDADRLAWLRLARSRRVGPATFIRLVREHGSAAAGLAALPDLAAASGVSSYQSFSHAQAEAEISAGHKTGARLLCLGEADYPPLLATIPDPPPVIWAIGDVTLAKRPNVALVGARNASSLGVRMAAKLATGLGEAQYCVASGLARGIDTACHKAALETGTIAVLAGGIDCIYPAENTRLAEQIMTEGLVLSEAPMGTAPQARHFPRRNRIISGLSLGVVVIEGAAKSGSLITARDALDQGREVMAVPGNPMDARASGCNILIRDGAALIRNAGDIIETLGQIEQTELPLGPEPDKTPMPTPKGLPAQILLLLGPTPQAEDTLIREIGLPTQQVLDAFLDLELSGKLARHAGGMVALAV